MIETQERRALFNRKNVYSAIGAAFFAVSTLVGRAPESNSIQNTTPTPGTYPKLQTVSTPDLPKIKVEAIDPRQAEASYLLNQSRSTKNEVDCPRTRIDFNQSPKRSLTIMAEGGRNWSHVSLEANKQILITGDELDKNEFRWDLEQLPLGKYLLVFKVNNWDAYSLDPQGLSPIKVCEVTLFDLKDVGNRPWVTYFHPQKP